MNRLISPEQTAELLGISLRTLRRMWQQGEGPAVIRVSARRQGCRPEDIDAYLDERRMLPQRFPEPDLGKRRPYQDVALTAEFIGKRQ